MSVIYISKYLTTLNIPLMTICDIRDSIDDNKLVQLLLVLFDKVKGMPVHNKFDNLINMISADNFNK